MDNFSIRICAYLAEGLFRCYEKQGTSLHFKRTFTYLYSYLQAH